MALRFGGIGVGPTVNRLAWGLDDGLIARHSRDRVDRTLTTLDRAPAILGAS